VLHSHARTHTHTQTHTPPLSHSPLLRAQRRHRLGPHTSPHTHTYDANTHTGSQFAQHFTKPPPLTPTQPAHTPHTHLSTRTRTHPRGQETRESSHARTHSPRARTHDEPPPLQVGKKSNLQTLAALAGEHEAFHNTPWTLADERRAIQKIDPLTAKMRCARARACVRASATWRMFCASLALWIARDGPAHGRDAREREERERAADPRHTSQPHTRTLTHAHALTHTRTHARTLRTRSRPRCDVSARACLNASVCPRVCVKHALKVCVRAAGSSSRSWRWRG
jgi:hypothetical protein